MKRISISFLCILLSVVMSGCGKSDAERVQDYLEKRYGEEFVVIDTKATSYGGPAFSYDLTASCYPVDNPEYIFLAEIFHAGTEEKRYSDCYAQGILNKRTEDKIAEKLADFPAEFSVFVNIKNDSELMFDTIEEVDYEKYFLESSHSYPSYTNQLQPIVCSININNDGYELIGFDKEYELFCDIIKDIALEIQTDVKFHVRYMPQELYMRYTEWYLKHPVDAFGMPTNYYYEDYKLNGEFHFELYEFNYSFQNEEMTSFNSAREIMTEELYKNKREESQLGNEE